MNSDTVTVNIMVTDVDEAPDVQRNGCSVVPRGADSIDPADPAIAQRPLDDLRRRIDPETDDVPTIALAGADRGKFATSMTVANLAFNGPDSPDYEKLLGTRTRTTSTR